MRHILENWRQGLEWTKTAGHSTRPIIYGPLKNGALMCSSCLWFETPRRSCDINVTYGNQRMTRTSRHYLLLIRYRAPWFHYNDVIMGAIASQITSLTIVYSTVYSAQIKENMKAPLHWPLCGEFTVDRWIPRANGQLRGKCFHLMTSSCVVPYNP